MPILFAGLCNPVIQHFSIALFSTFFILLFKISLFADYHLEPSQTSSELIIWSFPFRAEFPRMFSVTVCSRPEVFYKTVRKILQNSQESACVRVSFWCNFFELLKYKKVRAKHKFVNGYSATKRAYLYCK